VVDHGFEVHLTDILCFLQENSSSLLLADLSFFGDLGIEALSGMWAYLALEFV